MGMVRGGKGKGGHLAGKGNVTPSHPLQLQRAMSDGNLGYGGKGATGRGNTGRNTSENTGGRGSAVHAALPPHLSIDTSQGHLLRAPSSPGAELMMSSQVTDPFLIPFHSQAMERPASPGQK